MKLDDLLKPISEDAPCGPDLLETMDADFDAYYFGALGRLPPYYFRPGVERPDGTRSPDMVFDSGDVKIEAERKEINGLLARTKDVRLLVLLAQWEILSGRLPQCAQAVQGIAGLLEEFPDDVHPTLAIGASERRDAIADLNNQTAMVLPLQFLGLTGTDEVTLRKIKVAMGDLTPIASEEELSSGMLNDALSDPGNRKRVETLHAELLKLANGLSRIESACQGNATAPITAPITQLTTTVKEMLDAVTASRPELRGADVKSVEAQAAAPSGEGDAAPEANGATAPAAVAPQPAGEKIAVLGHDHARLILEACEHYYRKHEPSSAALLLVTQARLLIGRPLVEALQTLLPDQAGRALVDFGQQTGFSMNLDRLRELTDSQPQSASPEAQGPEESASAPQMNSSSDAAGAMRSVEDYFRIAERSSPVPILLQRARGYLDKDFQSLVEDLLPPAEGSS